MIKLKNITKKYGEKAVVDQVNLTLPKGKIIAFVGSNGAGKSTLISIYIKNNLIIYKIRDNTIARI